MFLKVLKWVADACFIPSPPNPRMELVTLSHPSHPSSNSHLTPLAPVNHLSKHTHCNLLF